MKVLIIEDEVRNANKLCRLLQEVDTTIDILQVLESVSDSVVWLQEHPAPDLIFMDIRLEDGLCFEIFDQVDVKSPVIFTTSYDEYALKAFKVNSIDYIMKPVNEDELVNALEKFKMLCGNTITNDPIKAILKQLEQKDKVYRSRFLIPFNDGFKTIRVEEIDYIFSEQKITRVGLQDKSSIIVGQTMEELEEELNPKLFFRANRQHILHIDSISSIQNYFNGKLKVVLKRDTNREVIVSREKAPLFKSWLNS
ncbi:MAG: LytTR family DNA-binding domain-containing protein [Flavobacteriaceae bacterium]|jgi:two-component system LytT family response regulator|nr:LytTR family DNA-binding domain-containing protein [Flavobacteriaceae bacterium]